MESWKEGKYPNIQGLNFLCYVYSFLSNIYVHLKKNIYELMSNDVSVLKSQKLS